MRQGPQCHTRPCPTPCWQLTWDTWITALKFTSKDLEADEETRRCGGKGMRW